MKRDETTTTHGAQIIIPSLFCCAQLSPVSRLFEHRSDINDRWIETWPASGNSPFHSFQSFSILIPWQNKATHAAAAAAAAMVGDPVVKARSNRSVGLFVLTRD